MGPAHSLTGLTLDGGWKVTGLADRQKNATGGFFSVGYNAVRTDGRVGFLKAMDYSSAVNTPAHMADMLHALTEAYLFEKNLRWTPLSRPKKGLP
jgi:hypothetical protein